MPEQDDKNKNNGADGGAGAGDGAGGGQGGNAEETVTIKKSDFESLNTKLKKTEDDRDNYRQAALDKKAKERELDGKGGQGAGDGAGQGGGQGGNNATIDESKVAEIAKKESAGVLEGLYKSNEVRAKRQLLQKHGELLDDANWTNFMSHFTSKRGKAAVEDIVDDFEDAMLLYKRSTGKLDEYLKSEAERMKRDGRVQDHINEGRDAGGAGDKNGAGGSGPSQATLDMAKNLRIDPKKIQNVDISKDNVIEVK